MHVLAHVPLLSRVVRGSGSDVKFGSYLLDFGHAGGVFGV